MSTSKWTKQFKRFRKGLPSGTPTSVAFARFLEARHQHRRTGNTPAERQIKKRRTRSESRRILKKVRRNAGNFSVAKNPRLLMFRNKGDTFRDTLSPRYMSRFKDITWRIRNRKSTEINLTEFSFSRNPQGTMRMLRELIRLSATHIAIRINFVDDRCDDVAPYIVLSQIIRTLPPVFTGGVIHPEVAAVVESVGLSDALGIGQIIRRKGNRPVVLPFKMRSKTPPKRRKDEFFQLKPQAKEDVSDAFCDTLNDWLETYDLCLTNIAEQKLVDSINESLDNAERHGIIGTEKLVGEWLIAGFSRLSFDDEGPSQIRCSFAIVSLGRSIAETLATAPAPVLKRVADYCNLHSRGTKDENDLLTTIMALQDGITRIPEASTEGRGGVGMMELIDIFADLGDNDDADLQSIFTVLSGKACLRIASPYGKGLAGTEPHLKELWFNEANDRSVPPSGDHVFCMEERLAGTVLTASFVMDREFLAKRFNDRHSDGPQS